MPRRQDKRHFGWYNQGITLPKLWITVSILKTEGIFTRIGIKGRINAKEMAF